VKQKAMREARDMVILRSSDETEFILPMEAAKVAELVREALPEEDEDPQGNIQKVDLIRVSTECLAKVVEFMKHHDQDPMKEIPTPLGGTAFDEVRTIKCS
jgi:Skp1 family, tetramerisation domain